MSLIAASFFFDNINEDWFEKAMKDYRYPVLKIAEIKEEISVKIESGTVSLSGKSERFEKDTREESLLLSGVANGPPATEKNLQAIALEISQKAKDMLAKQMESSQKANAPEGAQDFPLSGSDRQKLLLLQAFVEGLTGRKFKVFDLDGSEIKRDDQAADSGANIRGPVVSVRAQSSWGMEYHSVTRHEESEKVNFNAAGTVRTADGRKISFSLDVGMSRSFISEQRIDIMAGARLTDPLAINFSGGVASLSGKKYSFDLDSDGTAEQISFLQKGSGFLALDLNGDGKVNDGKELFGPQSGNGFNELAAYDSDGNDWIDENDAIYDKLRIWTKDESGNDRLLALGQAGVGAIYLGNVSTEFAYKDDNNQQHGQLRSSGVFLKEDGTPGSMQQIDLVV